MGLFEMKRRLYINKPFSIDRLLIQHSTLFYISVVLNKLFLLTLLPINKN